MTTNEEIKNAKKEIKALTKKTFNVPLSGKPYEPFKFKLVRASYQFGDKDILDIKDDQAFFNECYCREMDCKPFMNEVKNIARKNNVIASFGHGHGNPRDLEEKGKLDCDVWLAEKRYVK